MDRIELIIQNIFWLAVAGVCLGLAAVVAVYLFRFINNKFIRNRRSGDKRSIFFALTNSRQIRKAERLLASGNMEEAVAIFLERGMLRRAVAAYEDKQMIDEAVELLLKAQRPNRAGVVYARHQLWAKAARCFRLANMPLEVARCERELGNYKVAAEFFSIGKKFDDAAMCYLELNDLFNAARCYAVGSNETLALRLFHKIVQQSEKTVILDLNEHELNLIEAKVSAGSDLELSSLLLRSGRLQRTVVTLICKGQISDAARIYHLLEEPGRLGLIDELADNPKALQNLANFFLQSNDIKSAAIVHEKLGLFRRAIALYEECGDTEGATRCQQSGQRQKNDDANFTHELIKKSTFDFDEKTLFIFDPVEEKPRATTTQQPNWKKFIFEQTLLFSDLARDEKAILWKIAQEKEFRKGEMLCGPGKEPSGISVILQGNIRQATKTGDRLLSVGAVVGAYPVLFEEQETDEYSALNNCLVLFFPRSDLLSILNAQAKISRILSKNLTKLLLHASPTSENQSENQTA